MPDGMVRREGDYVSSEYRQAALELNAEIRDALAWIGSGCEPHVAHAAMLKTCEKWRPLLEGEAGHLG